MIISVQQKPHVLRTVQASDKSGSRSVHKLWTRIQSLDEGRMTQAESLASMRLQSNRDLIIAVSLVGSTERSLLGGDLASPSVLDRWTGRHPHNYFLNEFFLERSFCQLPFARNCKYIILRYPSPPVIETSIWKGTRAYCRPNYLGLSS